MAFLTWWFSVLWTIAIACFQITSGTTTNGTVFPDLYEASVLELQAGLDSGLFSSVDLVKVILFHCLTVFEN